MCRFKLLFCTCADQLARGMVLLWISFRCSADMFGMLVSVQLAGMVVCRSVVSEVLSLLRHYDRPVANNRTETKLVALTQKP